jgi:hypothetical protein
MGEMTVMAIKSLNDRTEKYLTYLSQSIDGYRGLAETFNSQLNTAEAEVDRLEAINAELLESLGDIVEIHRRDNLDDPDKIATDRWRHEVWSNAYFITKAEATP